MTDRAPTPLTDEEIADAIRDGESILASGNRGAWAFSVSKTVAGMRELQASRAKLAAWEPVVRAAVAERNEWVMPPQGFVSLRKVHAAVDALAPEHRPEVKP